MDYNSLKIGSFAMASSMGAEMVTSNIVDDLSSGANIITQIVILIVTFIKMFKKAKN